MSVLVTGGAGFMGSALVKRLLELGHEVSVLDDFSRGREDRLASISGWGGRLDIWHGDIRDRDKLLEASEGCETVIHLAYLQGTQNFYSQPSEVLDVATRGMLNVLDVVKIRGIRSLMTVSSSEAYQIAPRTPTPEAVPLVVPDVLNSRFSYGGGKILLELMTNAWVSDGLLPRGIIVRPHNVIGPDMGREHVVPQFAIRMNDLIKEHPTGTIPFPILGTGQETRSFCYVSDCVEQLVTILGAAPAGVSVWHVGVEDERKVSEVAQEVAHCYRREISIEPGELWKGSPNRRLPDTSKVRALGCKPRVDFRDAIKRTVYWYQQHG